MNILSIDRSGQPMQWCSLEDIARYYAKDKLKWTSDNILEVLRSGVSRMTGKVTELEIPSIIMVDSDYKRKYRVPALTNRNLFRRDLNMCAYCGRFFPDNKLTRDHIVPQSRGGENSWMNCVTACKPCNNYKDDFLLEEIDMELKYVPYTPDRNEALILKNKDINSGQFEYLKTFLPKHSRAHLLLVA